MEEKQNKENKWYLSPAIIIMLLFFVLGPLGLPLLYKSPRFSRDQKTILTVLVFLYTAYVIYLAVQVTKQLSGTLDQLVIRYK